MRPPECAICDVDVDESGALISFVRTAEDDEWYRRSEEEGFVGHPPNVDWFCANHASAARALKHLTIREAFREMES